MELDFSFEKLMRSRIETLFGRDILKHSHKYQKRLLIEAWQYWRTTGFPSPKITVAEIRRELNNLVSSDRLVNGHASGLLSTVGLRIANANHPQIWHIKVRGKSCIDVFEDDDRLTRALSKAPRFWPNRRCWNAQSVRTLVRISHKMRPSNFRPVVARQLIRTFSSDGSNILDFCAGFGGRLLGAVSLRRQYVGIDPAHAQIIGLHNLYNRIKHYVPGHATLRHACAEDFLPDHPSGTVDLVFSSPPYFDLEKYSAEPNQSYLRYPQFTDWVNLFFVPALRHSARILKPGGIMLLNVPDRPDLNLKTVAVDSCIGHLVFMGSVPYPMRANPVNHAECVSKSEPILIFQKAPVDPVFIGCKIGIFGGVTSTES